MPEFALEFVVQAIKGRVLGAPPSVFPGVSTDTRSLTPGALFVALRGESFDGHDFVVEALAKGAGAALVSRTVPGAACQLIVEDTLIALGALAHAHRARLSPAVVAVTGSTGKTSTKDMIAAILSQGWRTARTPGNFNNEIGVPLSLLELDDSHQAAVVELAMRGRGQISYLAQMAQPRVGVITNIGLSHLELLGSREAIAETKAELLAALPEQGAAVLNADEEFFPLLRRHSPCPVVSFGTKPEADVSVSGVVVSGDGETTFTLRAGWGEQRLSLLAGGRHHALNAAAAVAAAVAAGGDVAWIAPGLAAFRSAAMRSHIFTAPGGFTVIDDSYNASPDSMRAALDLLADVPGKRKWAALGDMKELGPLSSDWHHEIGQAAGELGLTGLVTVGELARSIAQGARELDSSLASYETNDNETAAKWLLERIEAGDVVLVKGSRAMKMEEIVSKLTMIGGDA